MNASTSLEPQTLAPPPTTRWVERMPWYVYLLLPPLLCHFGFSWIGFNPTDDGWLLAVARRLVEGELPHRDFIFVRPALSAVLHVPLVWWGGDHVIWLSRLWGWVTLAAVCWIWSGRAAPGAAPLVRFSLHCGALLLCAHTFPVMGWHSIDGMLFASLAVLLLGDGTPRRRHLAFFVAGLTALCRQNFVVFPPLLLLAVGGRPASWFAAGFWSALPSLLYLGAMAAAGAAGDFWQQVWSVRGAFWEVAVARYFRDAYFLAGLGAGAVVGVARYALGRRMAVGWWPALLFGAVGAVLAFALWRSTGQYHTASTALFGLVLALSAPVLRHATPADRLSLVAGLALSWSTSISIGYNSPALTSGVLLLLLWRLAHLLQPAPAPSRTPAVAMLLVALGTIGPAFSQARQAFPYRDRPAADLSFDVGEVLAGGKGLRTNSLTYGCLEDLQRLTRRFDQEGRRHAILTDLSAAWIRSPSRNPLPCEWPQETELGYHADLFRRVFVALQAMPEGSRIIVQKHLISEFSYAAMRMPNISYYFIQNWVAGHCPKVEETPFFDVYRLPDPAGKP